MKPFKFSQLKPMLATPSSQLPNNDAEFGYEIKWDGLRALILIDNSLLTIHSRHLKDITSHYPELLPLAGCVSSAPVILDGEIVCIGPDGRPSFSRLQNRMGITSLKQIEQRKDQYPVTYMIFDLLFINGSSILHLPYSERRSRLENLSLSGPSWQTPSFKAGHGQEVWQASRQLGLEGIIAKRLASTYQPGKRTGDWQKIKNQKRQELLICGWTPGQGARSGQIGALITGYYDRTAATPQLLYAGKVGTGFSRQTLKQLADLLQPLVRCSSPFSQMPQLLPKDTIFVEPRLIGEFEFTEWTPSHTLRHPVFKGLRFDKDPQIVVKET
ncbi:atp-dependent dna ligase signature 2 [Lucifera butyrica]|uniref:DNA ligase (ATP) n=1 Tax=Lucifera butyrica TaxID=1351585 RepID=A0A498RBR1_9FIRM|nr:non-homologous end-joining DNA ligase [Lucifera butyrica]VBB08679.1 atp-dependent dna ligase signature 2 [Lucifera butyrica]